MMKKFLIIIIFILIALIMIINFKIYMNSKNSIENESNENKNIPTFDIVVTPRSPNNTNKNTIQIAKALREDVNADLFFYKIDKVDIIYNEQRIPIEDAINQDIISMEDILIKAKEDCKKGIAKLEEYNGGNNIYRYKEFVIQEFYETGSKPLNIYIGEPKMTINEGL